MKKTKLLTIAIATYNMEDYLPRCVDSLLVLPDMDCLDILIVNDGSFDASLEIAKEYEAKYPGIVRVLDKQNGGYGSAINMAIDQALGKYFKTLDADDRFDKEGFVRYISKLNNIDADLVMTNYSSEIEFSGDSIAEIFNGIEYEKKYKLDNFNFSEMIEQPGLAMHAITYRTDILRKGGFRLSECYYSDVDYSVYPLVYVSDIVFLDMILYKYLIGRPEQSVGHIGLVKHFDDHLFICKKLMDFFSANYSHIDSILSQNIKSNAVHVLKNLIDTLYSHVYISDKERAKKYHKILIKSLNDVAPELQAEAKERIHAYEKRIKKTKKYGLLI